MTSQDRHTPRPLSAGDHAGLALLQEKLEAGEHPFGATQAELEAAIHSRFLGSFRNRVRAHGYRVFVNSAGAWEIDVERVIDNPPEADQEPSEQDGGAATAIPAVTGRSRKAPGPPGDAGLITRASVDGSLSAETPAERSGAVDGSVASPAAGSPERSPDLSDPSAAPVEGRLFELPSTRHFDVKAEAA